MAHPGDDPAQPGSVLRGSSAPTGDVPLVVISPHLDDAILSAGSFLAAQPRAAVLTVFAGGRDTWSPATDWDRACGFGDGDDVIAARRREDDAACAVLGALPVWLDFPEVGYRSTLDEAAVVSALSDHLRRLRPERLAMPLGLHHPDHLITHELTARAAHAAGIPEILLYADLYRFNFPASVAERVAQLQAAGTDVRPCEQPGGPRRVWRKAIKAYSSQYRGLGKRLDRWSTRDGERWWIRSTE